MITQDETAEARAMSDKQLVDAWDEVKDSLNMTPLQQAILDEIERRNLDI
ncbi:hypothetical protein [Sphingobium yanoikuyae]|nr:hypothetical protein [Sphingobium yanoikuyae]